MTKQNKRKIKVSALKLGTWNVRTLTSGLLHNMQQVSDAQKTAGINNELYRIKVDIIALQELDSLNLASSEKWITFFWQGKAAEKVRDHRVGFEVKTICWVLSFLHLKEPKGS